MQITIDASRKQSNTSGSKAKHKDFPYPVGRITSTSLPSTKDIMAPFCLSFKFATPMVAQLDKMAVSTASLVKLAISALYNNYIHIDLLHSMVYTPNVATLAAAVTNAYLTPTAAFHPRSAEG